MKMVMLIVEQQNSKRIILERWSRLDLEGRASKKIRREKGRRRL
jgi:hypothetical protein